MRPLTFSAARLLGGLGLAVAAGAQTAPGAAGAASTGKAGFETNCAACHQADGKGIPGAFPALANNAFVQGPPEIVVKTILDGRGGMPAFRRDLHDDQLAAILTYVRSAWGNTASGVTTEGVAAIRGEPRTDDLSQPLQAH